MTRGPDPKPAGMRQRRNVSATRVELQVVDAAQVVTDAPDLPAKKEGEWHALTRSWWVDVWNSPMGRSELLAVDVYPLLRLAILVDMFWETPTTKLSSEIRQLQQSFGLTPLDRRRLEWTVVQTEEAKEAFQRRRVPTVFNGDDVRGVLE